MTTWENRVPERRGKRATSVAVMGIEGGVMGSAGNKVQTSFSDL